MDITQLPVRPLINPLTSEDEALLRQVVQKTMAHADMIERMKQCGIPVSDHEDRNGMHRHVASEMIRLFFPPTITSPPV